MTPVGLTPQQSRLLAFIRSEIGAGRPAPSFREMQQHMGLRSLSNIHALIGRIVQRGHLVRMTHHARAVALPDPDAIAVMPRPAPRRQAVDLPESVAKDLAAYARRRRLPLPLIVSTALSEYMRRNP